MPLERLTSRQRELLGALNGEFDRGRTEFLAVADFDGWNLSVMDLQRKGQKLDEWDHNFTESDLRDLESEGYIRLDVFSRGTGGRVSTYLGSVTPNGREALRRSMQTRDSSSTGGLVEPPKSLPEPLPPGHRLDHYKILKEIGAGGRARVYEAVDTTFDDVAAVKVLSRSISLDPTAKERFKREVKLSRQVGHRNVCRIFGYGEVLGTPYYAMERIEGQNLLELRNRGTVTDDEAVDILDQAAAGVEAIHALGVVHRDLKSANIMRDKNGRVVVLDLGLAKDDLDWQTLTKEGHWVGTPEYMSPEQCRGEPLDARSDVYALGIVAYELLTGDTPFRGDRDAVLFQQMNVPPSLNRLPERFRSTVERALAKSAANRFASASELAGAFALDASEGGMDASGTIAIPGPKRPLESTSAIALGSLWNRLRPHERTLLRDLFGSPGLRITITQRYIRDWGQAEWNSVTVSLVSEGLIERVPHAISVRIRTWAWVLTPDGIALMNWRHRTDAEEKE